MAPFLGLTGEPQAVQRLARQLGWVARGWRKDMAATVSITAPAWLLVNPDGRMVGVFTGLLDPATIAADIQQLASLR
jgi:cytochrome oxidase Cu insertion factor (SCO1/SenC/PrrC family)